MVATPSNTNSSNAPSAFRRFAGDVLARFRLHPYRNSAVVLEVMLGVVGLGWALRLVVPDAPKARRDSGAMLAEALSALDNHDWNAARQVAADLRLTSDLPPEYAGGPAYVLGAVMATEATETNQPRERTIRHLLATRYLEEAQQSGFPPGREGDGNYLLGKSLHDAGNFARSLLPLHTALKLNASRRTDILGLLTNAYLRDSQPQLEKAAEYNREYLAEASLGEDERTAAMLRQGEILFHLGDRTHSSEILQALPEASPHWPSSLVLRGRLLMREGGDLVAKLQDDAATVSALTNYAAARELFTLAQASNPTDADVTRPAQYLTGLSYRKSAHLRPTAAEEAIDLRAALEQFGRVRRTHMDTPEGLSASLEEAEIQSLLGATDEALKAYRRTLRSVADLNPYYNPWLSMEQLQARINAAYTKFLDAGQFDAATQLAAGMTTALPAAHALRLQAEAREAAALAMIAQAATLPRTEAQSQLLAARAEHRQAGTLFARLAKLRFATRQYPDDLWSSAENYAKGQDYVRAVRKYTEFLDIQSRAGRPPALVALGESQLALHQPQEALRWFTECIEIHPRDPHSFRARVSAARAWRELGDTIRARELLAENLEHEALTPRSIEWRDSLMELGEILYTEGLERETQSRLQGVTSESPATRKTAIKQLELAQTAFHEAIQRLSEAVERDPNSASAIEARYHIAESFRHSAKLPARKLDDVTIDTTRKKLGEELQYELRHAEAGYRELIDLLNARQEETELSNVESRILRNCYFARADTLFDMQRYEDALQAYSDATNRYQHEPESLEAFVQMANCHRRLNRSADARGTLEQAKVILNRMRPNAEFLQTTRYDREEWGKILNWLSSL